jgi:hypothetical protein
LRVEGLGVRFLVYNSGFRVRLEGLSSGLMVYGLRFRVWVLGICCIGQARDRSTRTGDACEWSLFLRACPQRAGAAPPRDDGIHTMSRCVPKLTRFTRARPPCMHPNAGLAHVAPGNCTFVHCGNHTMFVESSHRPYMGKPKLRTRTAPRAVPCSQA